MQPRGERAWLGLRLGLGLGLGLWLGLGLGLGIGIGLAAPLLVEDALRPWVNYDLVVDGVNAELE